MNTIIKLDTERGIFMISIYDWFGYDIPIKERYNLINNIGFNSVMLWWSNGFGRDCHEVDEYRKGPQIARECGLSIENIHAPVDNQNSLWQNNIDGKSLTDLYIKCIEDCYNFEIPTMVIHTPNDDYTIDELGFERMKKIIEKAEKYNVNIALENMRNISNLKNIFSSIDSSRLGFCYDSGHHYSRYPNEDLLMMFGSKLMAVHLHDNNGKLGQHGLPFDGTNNWEIIMKQIVLCNYNGNIALEPMNWEYEMMTIEEFLVEAYKRAKKLECLRNAK